MEVFEAGPSESLIDGNSQSSPGSMLCAGVQSRAMHCGSSSSGQDQCS